MLLRFPRRIYEYACGNLSRKPCIPNNLHCFITITGEKSGLTKDEFIRDETLKRAFVRSIEIIGEASKKVPDNFREKHVQIDWRAMSGMRDKLIHDYFGVDFDIVWDVSNQ